MGDVPESNKRLVSGAMSTKSFSSGPGDAFVNPGHSRSASRNLKTSLVWLKVFLGKKQHFLVRAPQVSNTCEGRLS